MRKSVVCVLILSLLIINILTACNSENACNNESNKEAVSKASSAVSSSDSDKSSSGDTSATDSSSENENKKKFENPDENPRYQKAYAFYAKKSYDSAIKICDEELKKNADCFWAYNLKGISKYFANGNSVADECLTLIDKSVEINVDYYYGYFNMALIEKGTKKWDASIKDFQKVIDLKPDDTWSYYGIATVYADTQNKEGTLKYLKLALDLDSENVKEAVKDDMTRHFSKLKNDSDFKALTR